MARALDIFVFLIFWLPIVGILVLLTDSQYRMYLEQSVRPLDHSATHTEEHLLGFIWLVILSCYALVYPFSGKPCSYLALYFLMTFSWMGKLFIDQSFSASNEFRHQCQNMHYDTRLVMKHNGDGQLQIFNSGQSVRAVRTYRENRGGIQLALQLDALPELPFRSMQTTLSVDGLNSSVVVRRTDGHNSQSLGTVKFHMRHNGMAEIKLNSRVFLITNWWQNPLKIVDLKGDEVTRVIQKNFNDDHLAICGHWKNLDLSVLVASILQTFQEYGSECTRAYYWTDLMRANCQICQKQNVEGVCQEWTIGDQCQPEFRKYCKGIAY